MTVNNHPIYSSKEAAHKVQKAYNDDNFTSVKLDLAPECKTKQSDQCHDPLHLTIDKIRYSNALRSEPGEGKDDVTNNDIAIMISLLQLVRANKPRTKRKHSATSLDES